MTAPNRQARLIALVMLAALLFSPPLVVIVDRPPSTGLSWLPLYLFTVWTVVIGLAAWLLEHRHKER